MAARTGLPPMSSSALHQVIDAASCILFVDALQAHLLKHDTIFWYLATFGNEAEKAAAAKKEYDEKYGASRHTTWRGAGHPAA